MVIPIPVFSVPVPSNFQLDLLEKVAVPSFDVTTSTQEVIPPNKARTALWLINDSDTVIYLALGGNAAVLNQGIRLNAAGGSLEINKTNLTRGAIAAIHGGAGNKVLLITELESSYAD